MRRAAAGVLLTALLMSGCWNRLEVNDLGVVTGIGVDVGQESEVRVTLYIARAVYGKAPVTPGGPGPTWVVAREGADVADAMRNVYRASPRRISLHHVQVILLGEEYARRGVADVTDFVMRNAQLRQSAWPLVVAGRAADVLETQPTLEALQTQSLFEVIEAEDLRAQRLKEFLVARTALTHSAWLYSIHARERPVRQPTSPLMAVEHLGAGFFRGDQLQLMATPLETQLLLWMLGSARSSVLTAPCPDEAGKSFSVSLDNTGAEISPVKDGAPPAFHAHLRATANLTRSECSLPPTKAEQRSKLDQAMAKQVRSNVATLIRRLQERELDPVGFGKRVQLGFPETWKRISARWPQLWKEASVTVAVELRIVHSGLLRRPVNKTEPEIKE